MAPVPMERRQGERSSTERNQSALIYCTKREGSWKKEKKENREKKKFEHGLTTMIAVRARNLSKPAQKLHT
jgi:hypothetical protein